LYIDTDIEVKLAEVKKTAGNALAKVSSLQS